MNQFLTELKRSPFRIPCLALIMVDLYVCFGRGKWVIGIWPEASVSAQIASFYLSFLVAPIAAWASGRVRRDKLSDTMELSARPRWHGELACFAACLVYALIPYLVGIVAVGVASLPSAGPGFLWPGYLLLGVAPISMGVGTGFLVGRWVPGKMIAPALAAVSTFTMLLVILPAVFGIDMLLVRAYPDRQPDPAGVAARLGLALVVCIVAVAGYRRSCRGLRLAWLRSLTAPALSAVSVALALLLVCVNLPLQQVRPSPSTPLCTDSSPRICLWPDSVKYLPAMNRIVDRINALPPGLEMRAPAELHEYGATGPRQLGDRYVFDVMDGNLWFAAESIGYEVLRNSHPFTCVPKDLALADKKSLLYEGVSIWIASRLYGGPRPANAFSSVPLNYQRIGELIAAPEADQVAWVKDRLAQFDAIGCTA